MVSLLRKTLILLYQNPTLRTSFNLNYLLKGTISKYSHIEGWVYPHMDLGEIHSVQAISLTVEAKSRH